jgi:hypothetical protein
VPSSTSPSLLHDSLATPDQGSVQDAALRFHLKIKCGGTQTDYALATLLGSDLVWRNADEASSRR